MANIGEQVDILKFLPNHLIGTTTGLFLKAIQDYVNQMYEYKKDPTSSKCSISESQYKDRVSLLGKIKGLADLHDAKKVDHEFIGRIADLLGFDFGISMSEMVDMISVLSVPEGTSVPLDIETGTMVDVLPIPASACGVADPADKATEFMRHILVELPYWFQIKGTDKLAKIFFWCFGLMMKWEYGYTRNYSNKNSDWVYTENKNDTNLVEAGMIPTPHVRASFSLDDSFADSYALVSWLNSQGLSRVVTTLTSIKPINAVIEDVVFSFDFNEAGRSLKGLAVNMSLGIDNYHRFKDWNSSDNIWDSGVGAVDPISFSLKKIPVGYTFRDQQIGEILEGSYNTTVSGSVNASGANPSDIVFTLSTPVNYYAQEDLPDMVDTLPLGYFVDSRDGETYNVLQSGGLYWMKENFRGNFGYNVPSGNNIGNVSTLGRLYTWQSAMDNAPPNGWRLPTDAEILNLINSLGGSDVAGQKLKSATGWGTDVSGTNNIGFAALPSGQATNDNYQTDPNSTTDFDGNITDENVYFFCWSSTTVNQEQSGVFVDCPGVLAIYKNNNWAGYDWHYDPRYYRYAVRYVKVI